MHYFAILFSIFFLRIQKLRIIYDRLGQKSLILTITFSEKATIQC